MRAPVLGAMLLALAACGGDSTGPNSSDVSGQWTYKATNLAGSGISCNITGVTFALTQTGSTFAGSATGGTITCTVAGQSETDNLGTSPIANGQVTGNVVQFDIGSSDLHNAGTRSGNSITGTLTANITDGATTVLLSGSFSLVKQ